MLTSFWEKVTCEVALTQLCLRLLECQVAASFSFPTPEWGRACTSDLPDELYSSFPPRYFKRSLTHTSSTSELKRTENISDYLSSSVVRSSPLFCYWELSLFCQNNNQVKYCVRIIRRVANSFRWTVVILSTTTCSLGNEEWPTGYLADILIWVSLFCGLPCEEVRHL